MRNVAIGALVGMVVGVVLGVTVLSPKLKTHAASKAVLTQKDLAKPAQIETAVLPALYRGDATHWRSAPPFPSDRPNVVNLARDFSQQLSILSAEKMILPVLPAKEVIAPERLFGALASGRVDALFATADIGIDKEPALALFAAIPFGPPPQEVLSWLQAGNGTVLMGDLFAKHNITAMVCGYLPPESSGWFVNELESADQIQDLRIRISGLGAKVWAKAGASVSEISPEEVPAAFDQGALDGAVFSTPAEDAKAGYSRFAKNYYFPGWQNQGQPLLLLINSRTWKNLNQERQSLLQASCAQHTATTFAKAAQEQVDGLSSVAKQDVTLKRLPVFILDKLQAAWDSVLAEEARRNTAFRETWEDLNAFVKNNQTWREISTVSRREEDY